MIKTNDLKKGTEVKTKLLGVITSGIIADNKKGNIRLVDVKGSEVGLFDEIGSVYAYDIVYAKINEQWQKIEHTTEQLKNKQLVDSLF